MGNGKMDGMNNGNYHDRMSGYSSHTINCMQLHKYICNYIITLCVHN